MTMIKYLRYGYDEKEKSLISYVVDTLMDTGFTQGQVETTESKVDAVIKSFGELINILHDKKQLNLQEIEVILSTHQNINYKED
jgi:hypothetical protein